MDATTIARQSVSKQSEKTPTKSVQNIWGRFCESIEEELPRKAFCTWFQPIVPVSLENNSLTVQVPSQFYYEWIEGHYSPQIESALVKTLGSTGEIHYTVRPELEDPPEPASAPAVSPVHFSTKPSLPKKNVAGLHPRYTFENYIEGPPNRFARAASLAVSEAPGKTTYNPLLLYGGVGLGKTHLLQAIGHEVVRLHPSTKVKFISSERFTQDFVESIRNNRADEFSARWRNVDVLLLDDVQFLVGRDRTQMEFFHTFNSLHQAGKQIVLTSDKPPRDLDGLDERLVSRIGWGLVCDIGPPDFETRLAIVQKFADEEKIEIAQEVSSFLAENITKNVRDLQGAIIRLLAHCSLNGVDITLDLAKSVLSDLFKTQKKQVSVDTVQRIVSEHYQVSPDLLYAKVRSQPIARARMVAMALSVRLTELSLKQVGKHFGGRDHTTVLHARTSIEKWEQSDTEFQTTINHLIERIYRESV